MLALAADRRTTPRRTVSLAARIRLEPNVFLACRVQDISPMGAGLTLDYDVVLPLVFRLQIPIDLFEVECALRHKRDLVVGVEFQSARAEALARYG